MKFRNRIFLGSDENGAAAVPASDAQGSASGAGATAKRADSSAAQDSSGVMEDASGSGGGEAAYNAPQTFAIANAQERSAQDSSHEQKGSVTIEGWIFPAALGAISTLFLAIMVFFFRSRYMGSQVQAEQFSLGPTQMAILDEISQSDKIPTDISLRIGKSKSTVVEHLDNLCKAGLVEKISTPEKKFVFYRLSQQGRLYLLKQRQAA
jgi:DNA-binding MarR family transcriptional regulator